MRLKLSCLIAVLLLTGCTKTDNKGDNRIVSVPRGGFLQPPAEDNDRIHTGTDVAFKDYIRKASQEYGVDETLIKAIIQVESGFNPKAVSSSNAVGLMQIKASTAGKDAYRYKGKSGQPSYRELKDPAANIDLGVAYINLIQNQQLLGIKNPKTLRYATIVAYVNGSGALLRTFSSDRDTALRKINKMTPEEFYTHVKNRHPAPQATRYLTKVNNVYSELLE